MFYFLFRVDRPDLHVSVRSQAFDAWLYARYKWGVAVDQRSDPAFVSRMTSMVKTSMVVCRSPRDWTTPCRQATAGSVR